MHGDLREHIKICRGLLSVAFIAYDPCQYKSLREASNKILIDAFKAFTIPEPLPQDLLNEICQVLFDFSSFWDRGFHQEQYTLVYHGLIGLLLDLLPPETAWKEAYKSQWRDKHDYRERTMSNILRQYENEISHLLYSVPSLEQQSLETLLVMLLNDYN